MNTQERTVWTLDPAVPIAPQIARTLRERIIRNRLVPGERVSEAEIASNCGVSRQPVREAFIKLVEQGLLAVLPQRGTIITKIAYTAVLDARFLREAIEADIVKILAQAPDPGLVADLEVLVARQRALGPDDHEAFIQLDEDFHRTLAEGAGKGGAWKLIEALKSQMDRVRFLSLNQFRTDKLIDQHATVVASIAAGDMAAAEAAIRGHLREVLNDLPQIVAACPEFFNLPAGEISRPVNAPCNGGGKTR